MIRDWQSVIVYMDIFDAYDHLQVISKSLSLQNFSRLKWKMRNKESKLKSQSKYFKPFSVTILKHLESPCDYKLHNYHHWKSGSDLWAKNLFAAEITTPVCKRGIQKWIIHSMLCHTVFRKAFPFKDHPVEQIDSQNRASHTLFDKGMYFRIAIQWAKKEECRAIPPRELCALLSGMTVHTE